jgi:hypothetical protein
VDKVTLRTIALITGAILIWFGLGSALDWRYLRDLKLVVVSPSAAIPSGSMMVVSGVPGFRRLDSVEASYQRDCASLTIWCKRRAVDWLTQSGSVRLSLPFSETCSG